jgi:hypothetical protein
MNIEELRKEVSDTLKSVSWSIETRDTVDDVIRVETDNLMEVIERYIAQQGKGGE